MRTLHGTLNNTAIAHFLKSDFERFVDKRYKLEVRASKCRTKASFFVRDNFGGKTVQKKVAQYPDVACVDVVKRLSANVLALRSGESLGVNFCVTFGDVLERYSARLLADSSLSKKRKAGLKSVIARQLMPPLAEIVLSDFCTAQFDEVFVLPLCKNSRVNYVRTVFADLKSIMAKAKKLNWISDNPLAEVRLSQFVNLKDEFKECRINQTVMIAIFERLKVAQVEQVLIVALMVLFGFRIGETRQLKWRMFDFVEGFLTIPAAITKSRQPLRVFLPVEVVALLRAYKVFLTGLVDGRLREHVFFARNGCLSDQAASRLIFDLAHSAWSAHDLRKFARTCWADMGADYYVGEILLNHKLKRLDKTYIYTQAEKQKAATLVAHTAFIFDLGLRDVLAETLPRFFKELALCKAAI
ncbi:tyrosine-type recombinase/integrase [Alishewanella sp. SMS9]|nr:tyrosine-type recombinase/integrase [Alishewanella sp. SMS9]